MIRVPHQCSITMVFLCTLLLPNCQSRPRDTEEDASATALPQAVDTVLSRDRNDLDDPSTVSPLPDCQSRPRDTEEDASATALPQAVGTVLSRDRNDLDDPSPVSPLPDCQSRPRDTEEDASATALPQAVDTVLSRDRNSLDDPSTVSPLSDCQSRPRDTEEDASAIALPQAVDTVLSRDRNDLDDPSPGSPAPMPLDSGGAPLLEAHSTQPCVVQPLNESGPSAGMQQVDILVPELAFGQEAWAQYFERVEEVPQLPKDITTILDSPCPFWEGKRVRDTHLLTLIPVKVGSELFSLELLGELIKQPKNGGHGAVYQPYNDYEKGKFDVITPSSSYWVLMTRDVLPGSRSLTDTGQSSFVADHATRTGLPYALPTTLEAATTILMHHIRTGERLFTDNNPKTYTRCHEPEYGLNSEPTRHAIFIGNFGYRGLDINVFYSGTSMTSYTIDSQGVAVCRKL